jgi:hypothetical protein
MTTTQELYQKLEALKSCFASLPESIPWEDTSQFSIEPEDVLDMGTSGALNKVFHRMWGYKDLGIKVMSRGSQLTTTVRLLEETIPVADDCGIVGLWVDALCKAAEAAGGSNLQPGTRVASTAERYPRVQGKQQATLSFARIPLDEYHEQVRNRAERTREERELERVQVLEEAAATKQRRRERERLRKRDYRARRREKAALTVVVSDYSNASGTEFTDLEEGSDHLSNPQVSTVSHSLGLDQDSPKTVQTNETARRAWKGKSTAKRHAREEEKRGSEVKCRVNWQDHFLWQQISAAQKRVRSWSPQEIVAELYRTKPETFEPVKGVKSGLHKGTLAKWIDQDQKRWKETVLERVKAGGRQGTTRRSTTLVCWPMPISDAHLLRTRPTRWLRDSIRKSKMQSSRNSRHCGSPGSRSIDPSLRQSPVLTFSTMLLTCSKNSRYQMHGSQSSYITS